MSLTQYLLPCLLYRECSLNWAQSEIYHTANNTYTFGALIFGEYYLSKL